MKVYFIFFFMFFLGIRLMAQQPVSEIRDKILQLINSANGDFAVAFKDIESGKTIMINENESFHAASTMKTPVMIEVFKQANEGKIKLTDSVLVKNEFKSIVDSSTYSMDLSDDSGENLYNFIGKKKTIYNLVYEMITVSSNLATNILIDIVDAKNVMVTMKEIGANNIKVLRGVEDNKAFEKSLNNTTTAYDLLVIFEAIAKKEIISQKACEEMINILLDQKFNDEIPMLLPENVKVAHKTGSITGVQHDSGIVYLPDSRKYLLILLSKNLSDTQKGKEVLANISKIIYEFVVSTE